jgi:hypothetical protein
MSRGLFVLVIQIFVSLGVTAIGLWALARPRHLQRFVHANFALLPEVKGTMQITPLILRLIGVFALWYGATLIEGLHRELVAFGFG